MPPAIQHQFEELSAVHRSARLESIREEFVSLTHQIANEEASMREQRRVDGVPNLLGECRFGPDDMERLREMFNAIDSNVLSGLKSAGLSSPGVPTIDEQHIYLEFEDEPAPAHGRPPWARMICQTREHWKMIAIAQDFCVCRGVP